ncbi:MAG: DNA alkylation repair protein [Oscillospiraceae bacterium]|nr:DNA alkylation repair protein [Oscillospiraceae bacterium]
MDNETTCSIQDRLLSLAEPEYREFQAKLIPNIPPDHLIGIRTPALKKLAKELNGTEAAIAFLDALPHTFFDENQLHAFLLEKCSPYDVCLKKVDRFLPYLDNWATCDQLSPVIFKKNLEKLVPEILRWTSSEHIYTVRFGIGMLMRYYLEDLFDPQFLEIVSRVKSQEYYVRLMVAWYFATALAKQYDTALTYLEEHKLDEWTHNKTINKAVESYRISEERKNHLKTLKIRKRNP